LVYPERFDAADLFKYFGARDGYEISGKQAYYRNEATGVYFLFDIEEAPEPDEDDAGNPVAREPHVAFNLNFYRPHVFALEAEPEVAALIAHVGGRIEDPQAEGMGEGPYSREGFLRGWNTGNRFGFQMIGADASPPPPWPAAPELIEAIWAWNLKSARLQNEVGDKIFIPKMRFAVSAGRLVTCCAWTEGVPTYIPEALASHVIMVRQPRPSLSRMFAAITGTASNHEMKLIEIDAVLASAGVEARLVDGDKILHAPPTANVLSAPGVWSKHDVRIIATEDICGDDLFALMKKA
jgi:hypothetical protein